MKNYAGYLIRHWTTIIVVDMAALTIVGPAYLALSGARRLVQRLSELSSS
jgi:hypothetical protein